MTPSLQHLADLEHRDRAIFHGKYRGIVTDVEDPETLGRIRAKVPFVYGDEETSDWATPVVPFAGKDHGLFLLPEVDDLVWIEFENGNIERPLWTGCSWKKNDLPNPHDPKQRVLTSAKGLQIILDDSASTLQLKHPGGAEITLSDSSILLKLGANKIEISSTSVSVNGGALEVS